MTPALSDAAPWLPSARARVCLARDQLATSEFRWSLARVAAFIVALVVWRPLADLPRLAAAAVLTGMLLFAGCVRTHRRRKAARETADRELIVLDESLTRCGGVAVTIRSAVRPAGDDELPPVLERGRTHALTDQERDDLDLYAASRSVFGMLNRCSTAPGARRLRDALESPMLEADRIASLQSAVRRLSESHEARLRLTAAAASLRNADESVTRLLGAIQGAAPLRLPVAAIRAWSVPAGIAIVWGLLQLIMGRPGAMALLLPLLLINGAIYGSIRRRLRDALDPWVHVRRALGGYLIVTRQAVTDLETVGELGRLRGCFVPLADHAALPAVARRAAWSEHGGALHELFNWFFMFDVHVADALLSRVMPIRSQLLIGLSALADLEALLSLSWPAGEAPDAVFPQIETGGGLQIEDGRHLLIEPGPAVRNSLRLGGAVRTWVITGSNMSGKSTFLRMCGVNVLLAQIGAPVAARRMVFQPMRLITDLRSRDSLERGESYFLSEVRHLKRMIDPDGDDRAPVFGLIDEPLRGTNSREKLAASLAVVEHLVAAPHHYLVATHDEQVTGLADRCGAANHHFREDLQGGALVFDNVLRPGPATTRNALRVLRQEGFPDSLLARADHWLGNGGVEQG